jgi:hypothetical protein
MTTERKRCNATRADGQPCGAWARASGLCFAHDPALAGERDQARRAGGRNSARRERLQGMVPPRLIPLFDDLETALKEVRAGSLTPAQGNAIASLARALVTVMTAGELEERVRRLEGRADGT